MRVRRFWTSILALMLLMGGGVLAAQTQADPGQSDVQKEKAVIRTNVMVLGDAKNPQEQGATWSIQGSTFTFVTSEMGFESRVIKGVPFSADTTTEFSQTLSNGQHIYRKSASSLYRDSEGRTRREQTFDVIGTYGSAGPAKQAIFINDPVAGMSYVLNPAEHTATKTTITAGWEKQPSTFSWKVEPKSGSVGAVTILGGIKIAGDPGVAGAATKSESALNTRTESLGTQMIQGIQAEGTRTTETIPAGSIGNDSPIEIVSERWYSPELGLVVKSTRSDPMTGDNVYQLTNIRRGDPDPSLFQVPADYSVSEPTIKIQTIKKDGGVQVIKKDIK